MGTANKQGVQPPEDLTGKSGQAAIIVHEFDPFGE
jgi:hypothetical protein